MSPRESEAQTPVRPRAGGAEPPVSPHGPLHGPPQHLGNGVTLHPNLANFRHLRAFLAVCELGSFERAAHCLARPRFAVERAVQELECALSVVLFDRHGGTLACNGGGRIVRHRVERALSAFGAGLDAAAGAAVSPAAGVTFPNCLFHESRLRALIALVATDGDLAGAAVRLGVTPVAVSRSIYQLERSLDVLLFKRRRDGMAATPAGLAFSNHAGHSLFELLQIAPELDALWPRPAAA